MPDLDIYGTTVTVGDEFTKLSPQKQQEWVNSFAQKYNLQASPQRERSYGEVIGQEALKGAARGAEFMASGLAKVPGDIVRDVRGMIDPSTYQRQRTSTALSEPLEKAFPTPKDESLGRKIAGGVAGSIADPSTALLPGGWMRKIISAGMGGAGAALGQEVAGTPGAIVGGAIGGLAGGTPKFPQINAPSEADLFKAADQLYKHAESFNVPFPVATHTGPLADMIENDLQLNTITRNSAPRTFSQLDLLSTGVPTTTTSTTIRTPSPKTSTTTSKGTRTSETTIHGVGTEGEDLPLAPRTTRSEGTSTRTTTAQPSSTTTTRITMPKNRKSNVSSRELMEVARQLGKVFRTAADGVEREAASRARKHIHEFLGQHVPQMRDPLLLANANYSAAMSSKALTDKAQAAQFTAGGQRYPNLSGQLKTKLRQIYDNKKIFKTPEEKRAIYTMLSSKSTPEQIIKALGGLSHSASRTSFIGYGAHLALHKMGMSVLTPLIGMFIRHMENKQTMEGIERIGEMIRRRSPVGMAGKYTPYRKPGVGAAAAVQAARGARYGGTE